MGMNGLCGVLVELTFLILSGASPLDLAIYSRAMTNRENQIGDKLDATILLLTEINEDH